MKTLSILLSLFISGSALALHQGLEFHRQSLQKKELQGSLASIFLRADGTFRAEEQLYFEQKLDHADPNSPTFLQRYFRDSTYAENESSPVFYIICGEWNCAGTGSYGYAEGLAKKMKAHIIALEHRFYGESLPTSHLSTENLQQLNLDAAIEDLANFQRSMIKEEGLTGKWVAFGGSYAGTLAAFYRLKHPELIAGALASSAPVFMKPDFFEYDAHIAKVIGQTSCGDKVREAVKLIESQMSTEEGSQEVKKLFDSLDIRNDKDFLYVAADMVAAAVQYGRDKIFCEALSSSEDLVKGYAEGGLKVLRSMGYRPIDLSMQSAEKVEVTADDNYRQWIWQSCQEFGWFQVSNTRGETSRSTQIDFEYHDLVCQRLYGTPMVTKHQELNDLWYSPLFDPKTSKIIFSNGGNDPWLTLSVTDATTETNPLLSIYMMDGAAHCDDLRNLPKLLSVVAAQQQMSKVIIEWIEEDPKASTF